MKHTVKLSVFVDGEEYNLGFYVDPSLEKSSGGAYGRQEFLEILKTRLEAIYRQTPLRINEKEGTEIFTQKDMYFVLEG